MRAWPNSRICKRVSVSYGREQEGPSRTARRAQGRKEGTQEEQGSLIRAIQGQQSQGILNPECWEDQTPRSAYHGEVCIICCSLIVSDALQRDEEDTRPHGEPLGRAASAGAHRRGGPAQGGQVDSDQVSHDGIAAYELILKGLSSSTTRSRALATSRVLLLLCQVCIRWWD